MKDIRIYGIILHTCTYTTQLISSAERSYKILFQYAAAGLFLSTMPCKIVPKVNKQNFKANIRDNLCSEIVKYLRVLAISFVLNHLKCEESW